MPFRPFVTILMTMSAKPSPRVIKAAEFKAKCLELMDEVAASGETIVVTKRGKPVAKLGPIGEKPASLFGFLGGNFTHVGDVVSPVDVAWGPAEPDVRSRKASKRCCVAPEPPTNSALPSCGPVSSRFRSTVRSPSCRRGSRECTATPPTVSSSQRRSPAAPCSLRPIRRSSRRRAVHSASTRRSEEVLSSVDRFESVRAMLAPRGARGGEAG